MGGSVFTARPFPLTRARQDTLFTQASTFPSCAVCEHGNWPPVSPSLPARYLIPLFLQTPIHEVGVGLIRLRRTSDGVVQAGQQSPHCSACGPDHGTLAYGA